LILNLGPFLGNKAKVIRGQYDTFRANKDQTIQEISDFVKLIPGLKENYHSLNQHINITEELKKTTDTSAFRGQWETERALLEGEDVYEVIDELVASQAPVLKVLRIVCLQSLTGGGIVAAKYDALRRDIVQTYGYEHLYTLASLQTLGMLRRREVKWIDSGSGVFATARRNLRLIDEVVNVMNPRDISYVSSGYAPLSVRLVELAAFSSGWASIYSSTLQHMPRPAFDFTQGPQAAPLDLQECEERMQHASAAAAATPGSAAPPRALSSEKGGKKVLAVFFIGGVTFMEIAALRFLSDKPDFPFSILICTTKIVNGNTLMGTFAHDWMHMG